jgi:ABC-2 type transport system permease protein
MTGFVALLHRELWEHRSLLIVPATLGSLILAAVLGSALYALLRGYGLAMVLHNHWQSEFDAAEIGQHIPAGFVAMAAFFGIVLAINVLLYFIDCLYADRRDRSILFWKSLPISDTATVLSKLTTGLLVAPAAALTAAFATTMILAIAATVTLWASGVEHVSALWQAGPLLTVILIVPAIALLIVAWYAPVAAWCVLASAWAPRAPLLWAALPPVALIIAEQIAFRTTYIPQFLGDRMWGVFPRLFDTHRNVGFGVRDDDIVANLPALHDVGAYLTSLDLWGGLAVAALFAAAATALRRYRDET